MISIDRILIESHSNFDQEAKFWLIMEAYARYTESVGDV
jgi:hypothetical protein